MLNISLLYQYSSPFCPISPSLSTRNFSSVTLIELPGPAQTMARPGFLTFFAASMAVLAMAELSQGIGVNWGTMASHLLPPSIVVNLLKDNGITKVKLFDADSWTVNALAGSGIEVMLAIPNDQLKRFAESHDDAKDWVKHNVTKHLYDGGVDIRYVGVGNEPFLASYNHSFEQHTFPALQNIQKALDEAGHGNKIKATVPLNADVYYSRSDKPSDGAFRPDVKNLMVKIVKFLQDNEAPFFVNIYPFLSLYDNDDFPLDFAFFDGGKPIQDKGITYTNVFDANYDTLIWSLKKVDAADLKIVIGEVGWPTDGDKHANLTLAKRFYDGLLKKLAGNKGTPLRPGPIEVYLFGLLDENMKSIAPGFFERHWGIFRYDGKPKFPMDLSGKGHDKMLVGAKGVQYMENSWCLMKSDMRDMNAAAPEISYACANADCTSLVTGGTCNSLSERLKVSYGFNMYYQMQDQSVEACVFNGLAEIVRLNATTGSCLFPVQLASDGDRLKFAVGPSVLAAFSLSLFMLM